MQKIIWQIISIIYSVDCTKQPAGAFSMQVVVVLRDLLIPYLYLSLPPFFIILYDAFMQETYRGIAPIQNAFLLPSSSSFRMLR